MGYRETDRVVDPVLKVIEIESGSKQTRLESYFMSCANRHTARKVRSKRLHADYNIQGGDQKA